MSALQTFFDTNPALAAILPPVAIALATTMLLAYSGLGFLVGTLELRGIQTRRAAYDKCAHQLATICLVLGWCLLIASRIWIFFNSDGYVPQSFLGSIIELSWGALGIAVITASMHFALWKIMSAHKILHSILAYLSGLNGILATVAILGALRLLTALDLPNAADLSLRDLFNFRGFPSPLLSASVLLIPLCIGMPAALAPAWLICRRNRDDFGRDYYNTMVPWCAHWAFFSWVIVTLLLGLSSAADIWQTVTTAGMAGLSMEDAILCVARVLPALLATLLWALVWKTATPMRYKAGIALALLLSIPSGYFLFTDATSFIF